MTRTLDRTPDSVDSCRCCSQQVEAARAAELAAYRALPALSGAALENLVREGRTGGIVDGRTHQLTAWTNRDVAALACRVIGVHEMTLFSGSDSIDNAPRLAVLVVVVWSAGGF